MLELVLDPYLSEPLDPIKSLRRGLTEEID